MTILLSLHVISTDFCLSTVRNCSEIDHSLPLAVPLSVCKGLICFRFVFVPLLAVMHRWSVVHLASSCMWMQSVMVIWLTTVLLTYCAENAEGLL